MSKISRFKARLFLEGREVPFEHAQLNCAVNSPIVAQIDLVPLEVIKYIRPKTQVQLYIQDYLNFGDLEPRLAFEGEVLGRVRSKLQSSRTFSVICADYSEYWNEIKAYFYNTNFLVGKLQEIVTGAPPPQTLQKAAGVKGISGGSTLNSYMLQQLVQEAKKTDLVTAVAKILTTVANSNLYYKSAFDRLRISDRIKIRTSGRLNQYMSVLHTEEFMAGFTGRQGGFVSLREMLFEVMGLVFHDFVSVPFPSVVPVNVGGKRAGHTIANYLFVPDAFTVAPPKCNVLFPNQVIGFNFSEDFRESPTRFAFRTSLPEWVSQQTNIATYPIQYYPNSFKKYMNGSGTLTETEVESLLGPSQILTGAGGKTYSSLKYGLPKGAAVDSTLAPKLREQDFLTNEEAIKGIFFDTETFPPAISALAGKTSQTDRYNFTQRIGAYMFTKKRAMAANGSAELLYNPFLVPGFNAMFIDDSDAGQSFIAKVQNITHVITKESASTTVALGMCRELDEIDAVTGGSSEPATPEWFDPNIFGKVDANLYKSELAFLKEKGFITQAEYDGRAKVTGVVTFPNMSNFYRELLGCDAATGYQDASGKKNPVVSIRGLGVFLSGLYRNVRDDEEARDKFVWDFIRRPVATITQSLNFLGAKPRGTFDSNFVVTSTRQATAAEKSFYGVEAISSTEFALPDEFAVLEAVDTGPRAGRFDGKNNSDYKQLQVRRQVIDAYVELLKTKGGADGKIFRG